MILKKLIKYVRAEPSKKHNAICLRTSSEVEVVTELCVNHVCLWLSYESQSEEAITPQEAQAIKIPRCFLRDNVI